MLTVVREMATAAQSAPASLGSPNWSNLVEDAVVSPSSAPPASSPPCAPPCRRCRRLRPAGDISRSYRRPEWRRDRAKRGRTAGASHCLWLYTSRATAPASCRSIALRTSLLISGDDLDREGLRGFVAPLGDSGLVVGDAHMLKIHVHTTTPGPCSQSRRHAGRRERDRDQRHACPNARSATCVCRQRRPRAQAVVAVVAGEGNKELFRTLGVAAVVDGGQSMNPSAAQILAAVAGLAATEVVLLPNNSNVVLTAEQAAGMSERRIAVVPTNSIPPAWRRWCLRPTSRRRRQRARHGRSAGRRAKAAEITRAVRDKRTRWRTVKEGQVMGLVDGRLVAADDGLLDVFARVMAEFAKGDPEVVTVLTSFNGPR